MNEKAILLLASNYLNALSRSKRYNIQTKSIAKLFFGNQLINEKLYYREFKDFYDKNNHFLIRDFVYKNNLFTYRKFFIISPQLYLYYTYQVFIIYFSIFGKEIDEPFNLSNFKIFYSGKLSLDFNKIKQNSSFNKQYNNFKEERKRMKGSKVLYLDIQNFFDNINIEKLMVKLKVKLGIDSVGLTAWENLNSFFKNLKIDSLPQLHHSIASSILSQIYLMDITNEINESLKINCWNAIRFVDDIYINLNYSNDNKTINKFLDRISKCMYKDGLNFNGEKIKIYSPKEFNDLIAEADDYFDDSGYDVDFSYPSLNSKYCSYTPSKEVVEKVDDLLLNNGLKLNGFIEKVRTIFTENGLDLRKYKEAYNKYFSIEGEDANKVFNHLIYSNKWKHLLSNDILFKILTTKEVVIFDPSNFTIFIAIIHSYLKEINFIDGSEYFEYTGEYYSPLRSLIISEQLIVQNKISKEEFNRMAKKFEEIDGIAHKYFYKYIYNIDSD